MTRPTWLLLVLPLLAAGCQCPYDARRPHEQSAAPTYVAPDKSINVSPPMRYEAPRR